MLMFGLFHKNSVIPPIPPEPGPEPDPPVINPTILNISDGPVTINSGTFIPMNANYIKNNVSLDFENQYNSLSQYVENESTSYIRKYTMKEFLDDLLRVESNYSTDLITNIYINDELQEDLGPDSIIHVLCTNIGPTPGYNNFLYYKLGDNPIGTYTKNNLKFYFIDIVFEDEESLICEYKINGTNIDIYYEFGMTFSELPSSVTVTVVQ